MPSLKYKNDVYNTENPFVDILIYNLKILAFSCIIKDQYTADLNETISSIKSSDIYIACIEKRADIYSFDHIPESILKQAGVPDAYILTYTHKYYETANMKNKQSNIYTQAAPSDPYSYPVHSIPQEYHQAILDILVPWYIENYEEENEYYRMITGLPPKGTQGATIREFEYLIPDYLKDSYDEKCLYFHELGREVNVILEDLGVLDIVRAEFPTYKYLNYLTQGIDIYTARLKNDMQIIYSTTDLEPAITNEFLDRYAKNREYVLTAVYTKAMEIESDYYHSFMMMYTLLITFIDVLTNVQTHIVKKDVLDRRCIKYILSMFNVPYFKIIPYKYQERLCRNINKIVKYKSCDQGMLSIVNLFGFENLKIFKWYILKTRSLNSWGEFNYETKLQLNCSTNRVLYSDQITESLSSPSTSIDKPTYYEYISKYYNASNEVEEVKDTDRTIPYPFPFFLEKGNMLIVRLDDTVLSEEDYVIYDYDKIQFKNGIEENKTNVTYHFYYDIDTAGAEFPTDSKKSVTLYHTAEFEETDNPKKFDLSNNIEFSRFFISNDYQFNVIINGIWLTQSQYFVDYENRIITLSDDTEYDPLFDYIEFIFISPKKFLTIYESRSAEVTEDYTVAIPEPFNDYIANGNEFFMMSGNSYITNYTQNGTTITLDESYEPGSTIQFYFIYSNKSLEVDLRLIETTDKVISTEPYQTVYKTEFPITNYALSGYKAFIKTLGWWIPESYYTIAGNDSIAIQNHAIAPPDPGREFDITLAYIPYDRTQYKSISTSSTYVTAERDFQKRFTIPLPIPNFFDLGGKIVADREGAYLKQGDKENGFIIENLTDTAFDLVIENRDLRPMKNHRVTVTFYYFNETHEYQIGIDVQLLGILESDLDIFELNYPFYPYFETGHTMMMQIGRVIIPDSNIEMIDKFHFRFIGLDDKLYEKDLQGKPVTALFFYAKPYKYNSYEKIQMKSVTQTVENGEIYMDTPADQFVENKWPFFLTIDGKYIEPSEENYELVNHSIYPTSSDVSKVTINYIYKLKEGYMEESYVESKTAENNDLFFFRSELEDTSQLENAKDRANWKTYESVTNSDGWWNGIEYNDDTPESIKNSIYMEKFNYERTKYYQLTSVTNLSEFTAQIGLFTGMLYDDSLLEDKVDISIPLLSPTHRFKLSHLFIYMTALTYVFNGYEDLIIDSASKNLWVQGFNFNTDLDDLKEYLRKEHQHTSDFPIWDFITPTSDQNDLVEFVNTYKTDYNIRQLIVYNMSKASDYREYRIWKKIYNSLLVTKNNFEFFKKSDDTMAETYSDFLEDKDHILYDSLVAIKAIKDQETLEDEIMSTVDNILYILDEYVNGPECSQVFSNLIARDSSNVRKFINILLDFFKSYKVSLLSRSDTLTIGGSSDPDGQFKPMDQLFLKENTSYKTYFKPRIKYQTTEHCTFKEGIKIDKDPHAQLIEEDLGSTAHIRTYSNWIREDVRIEKIDKNTIYKYIDGSVQVNKIDFDHDFWIDFDLVNAESQTIIFDLSTTMEKQYQDTTLDITTDIDKQPYEEEALYIEITVSTDTSIGSTGMTIKELYNEYIAVIPEKDYGTLVVRIKKLVEDTGSVESFFAESEIQSIPEEVKFVDDDGRFISDNFENFSKDAKELNNVTIGGGICINDGKNKNFRSMFDGCISLAIVNKFYISQPIIDRFSNTSAGDLDLTRIFANCNILQRGITSISTPQVLDMTEAFLNCYSLISSPKIICSFGDMNLDKAFYNCHSLTQLPDIYFPEYDPSEIVGISEKVPEVNLDQTFYLCLGITKNTSGENNRGFIFTYCKPNLRQTFAFCNGLTTAVPMTFNHKVNGNLSQTYLKCTSLVDGGVYELQNTSSVSFIDTFKDCTNLKNAGSIIIHDFSQVSLAGTYMNCTSLTDISGLFTSTEGSIKLVETFIGCTALEEVTINMSQVTFIYNIFAECTSLRKVTFVNVPDAIRDQLTHNNLDLDTLDYEIIIEEET